MPLEAQNLVGGYTTTPIIHEIDIALQQGEWLSLVGANGSGKSTLLKLLIPSCIHRYNSLFLLPRASSVPLWFVKFYVRPQLSMTSPKYSVQLLIDKRSNNFNCSEGWLLDKIITYLKIQ